MICSPLLRSGGRREPWSFVVLAVAAVFVPTAVDLAYRGDVGESMRGFVVYPPVLHVPTFLMGIALGRRYLRRRSTPAGGAARPGGGALAAVSAALVVAILAAVPTIPDELLDYYSVPFFAVLIYGLAMGGGVLGRFLAWKPMVLLGEASYSFYLLHVPVSLLVARALGVEANAYGSRAGAALLRPWQTTLCLLTACAASVATLVFLERPARAYIRRAYAGRVARGTAQEA